AGVLNLVPYLGSIMASVPALIIGAFVSPLQLFKVIVVIAIEQTLEGRVISPQILGNKLEIHPFGILFILLVAGSLFGFMGLILAVPALVFYVSFGIYFLTGLKKVMISMKKKATYKNCKYECFIKTTSFLSWLFSFRLKLM